MPDTALSHVLQVETAVENRTSLGTVDRQYENLQVEVQTSGNVVICKDPEQMETHRPKLKTWLCHLLTIQSSQAICTY